MSCSVIVNGTRIRYVGFQPHPCRAQGPFVERDGKLYCGSHDPVRVAAREHKYEQARRKILQNYKGEFKFDVVSNGDLAAGLRGFTDTVNVQVESGNPGGEDGEFAEYMRQVLADWFDCKVTAVRNG